MTDPADLDLRDIHLPPEPSWWPPAVGWWLLVLALIVGLLVLALRWRHYRAERVRRLALQELDALGERCASTPQRLPAELSTWLRRVALSVGARRELAGLTGQAWLGALERLSPDSRLTREFPTLLVEGPYAGAAPASEEELAALLAACREWTANLELRT
ncbi:MAG: DUF4381 domain-containing protein [Pseudomonadota bacterium]